MSKESHSGIGAQIRAYIDDAELDVEGRLEAAVLRFLDEETGIPKTDIPKIPSPEYDDASR